MREFSYARITIYFYYINANKLGIHRELKYYFDALIEYNRICLPGIMRV